MEHFRVTRFTHTPAWSMKLCFSTFDTSFFLFIFLFFFFCCCFVQLMSQQTWQAVCWDSAQADLSSWMLAGRWNGLKSVGHLDTQKMLLPSISFLSCLLKKFYSLQLLCLTSGFTGLKPTSWIFCLDFSSWTWPFLINYHKNPSGKLVLWFFHSRIHWSGLMHSENIIFSPLFIASSKNAGY